MKDSLFFHIRDGGNDSLLPHTYCVKALGDRLCVGYSIVHENDQFCKKTGRTLAQKKAHALTTIPPAAFKPLTENFPESIGLTINDIVQKSGQIFGLVGRTKVCTFVHNRSNIKVPVVKDFEITPVTPTQMSDDIFHSKI
jgi:hypothetical protein